MFTSVLYVKSPVLLQSALISVRGLVRKLIRENRKSRVLCSQIIKNETDAEALDKYSTRMLEKTLTNAVENVEAYSIVQTSGKDQLDGFPLLDKDGLRRGRDRYESNIKPIIVVRGSTSGTTGTPLEVPQPLNSVIREQAFISRMLLWAGFEKGDKRAWIRGDLIVPAAQKTGPYWRYSWFENMILMSSFHMKQDVLPQYIDAMVRFGVNVVRAYPSSIVTLAKYLESRDEYYPGRLKSIITSSEYLSPKHRHLVEERFRCKVFDWYGQFERVAAIANCEHGRYHILTDYSHVELIGSGRGRYEIVGTSFTNNLYPLIRYRTGDHVLLSEETVCPCGRVYPLVKGIEGRVVDYVFATSGHKVFALDQCVKGVSGVLGSQYVQSEKGQIEVRVVADSCFDSAAISKLIYNVKVRLGEDMFVSVVEVEMLERTINGKVRQAICNVKD